MRQNHRPVIDFNDKKQRVQSQRLQSTLVDSGHCHNISSMRESIFGTLEARVIVISILILLL